MKSISDPSKWTSRNVLGNRAALYKVHQSFLDFRGGLSKDQDRDYSGWLDSVQDLLAAMMEANDNEDPTETLKRIASARAISQRRAQ